MQEFFARRPRDRTDDHADAMVQALSDQLARIELEPRAD